MGNDGLHWSLLSIFPPPPSLEIRSLSKKHSQKEYTSLYTCCQEVSQNRLNPDLPVRPSNGEGAFIPKEGVSTCKRGQVVFWSGPCSPSIQQRSALQHSSRCRIFRTAILRWTALLWTYHQTSVCLWRRSAAAVHCIVTYEYFSAVLSLSVSLYVAELWLLQFAGTPALYAFHQYIIRCQICFYCSVNRA